MRRVTFRGLERVVRSEVVVENIRLSVSGSAAVPWKAPSTVVRRRSTGIVVLYASCFYIQLLF